MATYLTYVNTAAPGALNEILMKESVEDLVINMFPLNFPLQQDLGTMAMGNVEHNYPMDTFANITRNATMFATDTTFAKAEGSTATTGAAVYPKKLKGIAEIHHESFAVSGTDRAINQYGITDRYTYEASKYAEKVTQDFELSFHWSPGSVVGGADLDTTGSNFAIRQTQGLCHWIGTSGFSRTKEAGASATDGNGNVITAAFQTYAEDLNGINLSKSSFENLMHQWYLISRYNGDMCNIYVSPKIKTLFQGFALQPDGALVQRNVDAAGRRLPFPVDVVETEYGIHFLKNDFYLSNESVTQAILHTAGGSSTTVGWGETMLAIHPRYYKIGILRPTGFYPVAKTGDFDQGAIVGEKGLLCTHPMGGVGIFNGLA